MSEDEQDEQDEREKQEEQEEHDKFLRKWKESYHAAKMTSKL